MIQKFRKKPVVIEAIQFTPESLRQCIMFVGTERIQWWSSEKLIIRTLEGNMTASPNDWIIKGVQNEVYPCKPDIFEQTYDKVEA
jgi:hypothetical protein